MNRPSPRPPTVRVGRAVGLPESLEYVGQKCRFDPRAGIDDAHFGALTGEPGVHVDATAGRRELHRVGQQVEEDLFEAARIGGHGDAGLRLEAELDALRGGEGHHRLDGAPDVLHEVHVLEVDRRPARHNAGHVEQVFDQAALPGGVVEDRLDGALAPSGIDDAVAKHGGPAEYRVERRSQLV